MAPLLFLTSSCKLRDAAGSRGGVGGLGREEIPLAGSGGNHQDGDGLQTIPGVPVNWGEGSFSQ